ncbi:pseudaminic acid synthase [Maridesulfovibrio salexigens]|uniref:N-acylneuraminate-9-phosphate synthase n=1 Tax=Maridesulfovibrio salexigens (strain ATCC 14822 / DSM 2638 / NCIMB 8403 / VKM B-1763) TaxID=526222 RepID=C6BTJ9_MARSD|nr:pseudaminic acid synthase [Maridesulfovibrio salexigens]ACS81680.1 N-acylneuraminate-9-phosphate synthase [Maridesulfovibrio salexigens DSM 2638]
MPYNKNVYVEINGQMIGPGKRPFIVAEMSGNHNGDIQRAFRIIDAAKQAGADAVKIQTYRPDTITINHDSPDFMINEGLWAGYRLYDLYEKAHTPWEWHKPLFEYAQKIGITLFSAPFDHTAVDLLEQLNTPAYKIASPELIDLPLIQKVARTGKPIVMSTGMATLEEIEEAVEAARSAGAQDIILLHCTAAYPTPPEEANLSTIKELSDRFGVMAGLSDHSMGTTIPILAAGLGAVIIEKHFTLSRKEGGVDSAFSLETEELTQLTAAVKEAHTALGSPAFSPTNSEMLVLKNRRSLYVVKPVVKGEALTEMNIRSIRPGNGLKPKFYNKIIGKKATRDLNFGEPLDATMIEGGI